MLQIVQHPDARLRQRSAPIAEITPAIRSLAADMLVSMDAFDGCGLAAIQVGEAVRLVTLNVGEHLPTILVNPEIVWSSRQLREHNEGCLSIPGVFATLKRSDEVHVRYRDLDDTVRDAQFTGKAATCIQHEIDHLDGRLFLDRLSRRERDAAHTDAQRRAERKARDTVSDPSPDLPVIFQVAS